MVGELVVCSSSVGGLVVSVGSAVGGAVGCDVASSLGVTVVAADVGEAVGELSFPPSHVQCVAGQLPRAQFVTHHSSMLACPDQAPAARHPPVTSGVGVGALVAGSSDAVGSEVGASVATTSGDGGAVSSVGSDVGELVAATSPSLESQTQCVAGQFVGQLATHQASMFAWPVHAPAARHLPPLVGVVVVSTTVGELVCSGSCPAVGGCVGSPPPPPPFGDIFMSAQFQNVSG